MNLNSYIGLMGGSYHEIQTVGGTALVPARPGTGWQIPNPDYVVTLDADSVLLPEYCLRLVHLLEQQEYQDIAIAQTPVQRVPRLGHPARADRRRHHRPAAHRPPGHDLLRRHLLGRGQRGASARRRSTRSPRLPTSATGRSSSTSRTAPSSRTPSPPSTWALHGWRLFNYPERLSYSATPPDFGSLCIQRRRWANGGLLILPKLQPRESRRGASRATRSVSVSCSCAGTTWRPSAGARSACCSCSPTRSARRSSARCSAWSRCRTSWRWPATCATAATSGSTCFASTAST